MLLLALLAGLVPVGRQVGASSHTVLDVEPVFDGVVHERFSYGLSSDEVARGDVLRIDPTTEHLRVEPVQAQDHAAGLETTERMARRTGSLAGTNGGYWLGGPHWGPTGVPNGFAVADGRLLSNQAVTASGLPRARAILGFDVDGGLLIDQLLSQQSGSEVWLIVEQDAESLVVDQVNRLARDANEKDFRPDGELLAFTPDLGLPTVRVPNEGYAVVVGGLELRPGDVSSGVVEQVHPPAEEDREVGVPADGVLLVSYGSRAGELAPVAVGDTLSLVTEPEPVRTDAAAWQQVVHAVPGGPLLVFDGTLQSTDEMEAEAFAGVRTRRARTAVGVTGDGEVLLVTIDEVDSPGVTLPELARFMRDSLGARYAMALDGGGSTAMTIDGQLRNRSSNPDRSVANGLFVFSDYPFTASTRLAGGDRYATAARVARNRFPGGTTVVLATGQSFPDALAGGPLAASLDAPLLLTRGDELPRVTRDAITDLPVEEVVVLGGQAAVADEILGELDDLGLAVERTHGSDRYATAAAIARALGGSSTRVFLAAGRDFPDALTAAAPAGMLGVPVLLTERDWLPAATRDELRGLDPGEVIVVGGTAAVTNEVVADVRAALPDAAVTRLAGEDRYDTARAIADWAGEHVDTLDPSEVLVASGVNFPDALAGGPLAGVRHQQLMIVPPRDVDGRPGSAGFFRDREGALERVTLLGGRAVLSSWQHWQLDQHALR